MAPPAPRLVTVAERRSRLALRHRLVPSRRIDDVAAVARSLGAVHSTDPATAYLSITQRLRTPAIDAVTAALYERREIVRHHAMRRTLWLFEPSMARAAHAACTAALAVREWKGMAALLESSGVTADGAAWIRSATPKVVAAVHAMGTATARQIGAAVPELNAKLQLAVGKPYSGTQGAHSRMLQCLGFDGTLVRTRPTGGWTSGEYAWSSADDWCGGIADPLVSAAAGAATLARAYLVAFGPATTADLQWWAGWSGATTKQALAAIGAVAVQMDDGAGGVVDGWLDADDIEPVGSDEPWCAVLPSLDPAVMGWKSRAWYLGDLGTFGGPLFDRYGNAGHHIWSAAKGDDGRVVGTWAQRPDGEIVTRSFGDLAAAQRKAIDREVQRLRATLGDTRFRPRFPAPIQAELLA